MDIVNRTKKMDGKATRPASTTNVPRTFARPREDEYTPIEDDIVEEKPKKRAASKSSNSSLFGNGSAISKALGSKTKKSTSSKSKSTTKTTTKKTTKTTAKNNKTGEAKSIAEKLNAVAKKTEKAAPKKSEPKTSNAPAQNVPFDTSDPKNAELYSALKSALFDGGTDISEYMPIGEDRNDEAKTVLSDLQAKREAQKINKEISKEQQEYEQLFNGSFFMEDVANAEQAEDADQEDSKPKKKDLSGLRAKLSSLENKNKPAENRPENDQSEISVGNADLDRKIAEYYKRKQEKINELIKQEAEEELEVKPAKVDDYTARQNEYEDIFSGEMVSRDEIMQGMAPAEQETSVAEPQVEVEETKEVVPEETTEEEKDITPVESDNAETEETEEVVEPAEQTEVADTEETETTEGAAEMANDTAEEVDENETVESGEIDDYIVESSENEKSLEDAPVEDEQTISEDGEPEEVDTSIPAESKEEAEGIIDQVVEEANKETEDIEPESEVSAFEESLSSMYEKEEKQRQEEEQKKAEEERQKQLEAEEQQKEAEKLAEDIEPEYIMEENEPSGDGEVDDYIVSANMPEEEFRPRYEETDSSIILDSNVVNPKLDIFGDTDKKVEESQQAPAPAEEKDESDTISKEEFYNEMSRLQENLINELKGNKVEAQSVDLFATPEPEPEETEKVEEPAETTESEDKHISNEDAGKLVEEIISDIKSREGEEVDNIVRVETNYTPEQQEKFDSMDLLGKDKALDDADLQYIEQKKQEELEHEPEKDGYFYGSAEHKEKEEAFKDEYMSVYSDETENASSTKEMGDINLNKDIANAISSSQILEELAKKDEPAPAKDLNDDEEMEMIYTLFGTQRKKVTKMENELKVLYVAGECQPFMATGGLADVAGSLPKAIAKLGGVDIRVIMPMYGKIKDTYRDKFEYLGNFTVHLSWRQEYCGIFRYYKDGVTYYFVDNERYFKRDTAYGYYDDGERFAYFSKAVVECLPVIDFFPDIIHCNDWQTALVSTYIKTGNWSDYRYYQIKNVYTIHNVEYQGTYGMENLKDLFGIDYRFRNDMEYNGDINLTKAAIQFCDKLTTVSNSYCDNLKQPYCSRGLHHIIIRNEYKLCGIINGVDTDFYNPATDTAIYKNYTVDTMQDKVMNKKIWQDELGLPVDGGTPMLAIVSRLVSHKGLDLVSKMMEGILQQDVQLVVVGTGDQRFIDYFKYLENKYPTKVRAMTDKYSNELARKAYAASDIFIMPSKIEPCGISQMIASIYGSVPIVREVGGLKDTITDFGCPGGGNGYTFTNYNPNDLAYQVDRAINDYHNKPEWEKKMRICMTQDFTWAKSAQKYIDMYKSLKN